MLMWRNNGPWKWTRISRETIPHSFPMPHPDLLEQAIDYRVPVDMFDDLARYDGSVIAERTKGELSARCDKAPISSRSILPMISQPVGAPLTTHVLTTHAR